jgi:hypothetical protein
MSLLLGDTLKLLGKSAITPATSNGSEKKCVTYAYTGKANEVKCYYLNPDEE